MYAIQSKKRKNSKNYKLIKFQSESKDEIADYMIKNNIVIYNKPYIFTHLGLSNGDILTCSIGIGENNIICSPEEIYLFLKEKNTNVI